MYSRAFENEFSGAVTKLKGLSILLVVLGHFNTPLNTVIYSFHIPLFFFLGGFFLNVTKETSEYCKNGFNRLIVPYLVFGFVGWLINFIKNWLLDRYQENIFDSITGLIWWMDIEHLNHYGFVLWFLPALFWARIFVFFLVKYFDKNSVLLLGISSIAAIFLAKYSYAPLGIDKALIAFPWLSFGFIFYRFRNKILDFSFLITCIAIIIFSISVFFNGTQRLDLATKYLGNLLFTFPYTFSVLCIAILVCLYFEKNKLLSKYNSVNSFIHRLGMHTLFILVVHPYTNNISNLVIDHFFRENLWPLKYFISLIMILLFLQLYIRIKRLSIKSTIFKNWGY